MFVLIRENPAIRTLPRWLGVSVGAAVFVLNFVLFYEFKYREAYTGLDVNVFVSMLWLTLSLYLIFGEVSTRCSPFNMALPVSTRRLWLSHIVAVTLAGVAILAATAGFTIGGIWLLWKLLGKWLVPVEGITSLAAQLSAGLILAVVLLQRSNPPLYKAPRSLRSVGVTTMLMAALLTLIMVLKPYPSYTAIVPLAIAIIVGIKKYRSLPEAFTMVPAQAQAVTSPQTGTMKDKDLKTATARRSQSNVGFGWFLSITVHKCSLLGIKKKMTPWVTVPILIIFGALLAGLDGIWLGENLRYAYIPLAVYMLMAFAGMPMTKLGILDSLPIPRRRLFAVMILPGLVAMSVGYAAGTIGKFAIERSQTQKSELIKFVLDKDADSYFIHVPIEFCEVKWGGDPPAAKSPWGETQDVWYTPLFKGSPVKIYLPTASGPKSSLDFAALQLSRATEAVYGEAVPPDEIKERYLEARDDGSVGLKGQLLTIQADYPHLERKGKGAVFPVVMALVSVLWMLLIVVYLRAFRAGITKRARTFAFWGTVGIALLLWLGQYVAAYTGFALPYVTAGFIDIVIREAGEVLPGGAPAVWIVCALLVVGAYRIVAGRFERVEMPYEAGAER